jgi:urease accessory protein
MSGPMPAAGKLTAHVSALQLADSAFPSGRYTLSYGLEAVAQSGLLGEPCDPSDLVVLLGDGVRFGVASSDGVALACAHRAVGAKGRVDLELVTRADERLAAVKLAREAREASLRTGRALLGIATSVFAAPAIAEYAERVAAGRCPGNHAVVLGLLSASLGVPRLEAIAGELYAVCAGWVAAAVRLVLIDHCAAQAVLHRVRPMIAEAAVAAVDRDISHISGCTPLQDLMSMRHEQAGLRLFAS